MHPWDGVFERRWAMQEVRRADGAWVRRIYWFSGARARDQWVSQNPLTRVVVGKRHPSVKRFRNGMAP